MENQNLSELVKNANPQGQTFSESDLDLPEEQVQETPEVSTNDIKIPIINLSTWFEENVKNFTDVSQVKVSIRGIDPSKTIIFTLKEKTEDNSEKRSIKVFDDADTTPVLNLPGIDMQVYNNGFRIIHNFENELAIKAYGVKTGLILTSCYNLGGKLIPYQIIKAKKKDTEITIQKPGDANDLVRILADNVNLEALQLLYKQSSKADGLRTKQDAVTWLLERQEEITDINHHLQIDSVIIEILYK